MTRFSPRFALPLALLLGLALAGVLWARSVPKRDECPASAVLFDPGAFDPPLEPLEEPRRWTAVWRLAPQHEVSVAMVSSYGLPHVVLEPTVALPGREEADDVRTGELDTPEGPLPVHYAYERRGRSARVTAYVMAYRGEPVRSPIWTRVSEGPAALATGTWPIRLFAAAVRGHVSQLEERRADADRWLRAAWARYRALCGADRTPDPAGR